MEVIAFASLIMSRWLARGCVALPHQFGRRIGQRGVRFGLLGEVSGRVGSAGMSLLHKVPFAFTRHGGTLGVFPSPGLAFWWAHAFSPDDKDL